MFQNSGLRICISRIRNVFPGLGSGIIILNPDPTNEKKKKLKKKCFFYNVHY